MLVPVLEAALTLPSYMNGLRASIPLAGGLQAVAQAFPPSGLGSIQAVTRAGSYPQKPAGFGYGTDVQEATTNLVTNPKAGAGATSGWSANGSGVTLTAVTFANEGVPDPVVDGVTLTTGFKLVTTQINTGILTSASVTSGQPYAATFSIYRTEAIHSMRVDSQTEAGSAAIAATANAWQRVTYQVPSETATGTHNRRITDLTAGGMTLYFTGVQWENKAYATSYCDGSLGDGFSWTGTANASTSQRALTSLTPPVGLVSNVQGCAYGWIVPNWAAASAPNSGPRLFSLGKGTSDYLALYMEQSSAQWTLAEQDGTHNPKGQSAAQTFVANAPQFVYAGWDATTLECGANGNIGTPVTRTATLSTPDAFRLGDGYGGPGTLVADGVMYQWHFGNRRLTSAEVQAVYNLRQPLPGLMG